MDSNFTSKFASNKKRPHKGLRACWECKKRKVSTQSTAQDSQCGTGVVNCDNVDDSPCPIHIGERLSKLEQLFERFVCRRASTSTSISDFSSKTSLLRSDESTQQTNKFGLPDVETQSLASMSRRSTAAPAAQNPPWSPSPSIKTLSEQTNHESQPSCESVRRSLIVLLPSQHDADIIFESSNGWMVLNGMYRPSKDLFVDHNPQSYALNMAAVTKERTVIVARTLLHLAVCISSLPPEFDASRLSQIWNLEAVMQNYVSSVASLVMVSDEQMSTLPGLEALLLLTLYHVNSANMRQAWLVNRRALNLAHLMGFHRIINRPESCVSIEAIRSSKFIWRCFVDLDRYFGLHLRLPFASQDYPCPEDADEHVIHRSKLAAFCRQVSELEHEIAPQTYARALALDEKLDAMMREQSKEFWDVPNVTATARTPEAAAAMERLVVQMWHFELKVMIHLPYLLRAPKESRFEFSKITALQASRNIVMRWFALRNAGITQACSHLAEIGVFIATVTLILDILIDMSTKEISEVKKIKGSDFAMICRIVSEMEKLGKSSSREPIAARSATAIKKLLSSCDPRNRTAGRCRVTMPYFGPIEIALGGLPIRPPFDLDSSLDEKFATTTTGQHLPVFSFLSNSLWPPTQGQCGGEYDFDVVLFDGLQDKDTEGNWVF